MSLSLFLPAPTSDTQPRKLMSRRSPRQDRHHHSKESLQSPSVRIAVVLASEFQELQTSAG
jgi:hypothetical protein